MARKLFIDTDEGRLVSGLNSSVPPDVSTLFEGDNAPYELFFLQRQGGVNVYTPRDVSAASVKLHIGEGPPSTATAFVAQQSWADLPSTSTASVSQVVAGGGSSNEQQTITFDREALEGSFVLSFPSRTIAMTGAVVEGVFTSSNNHGLATGEPFIPSGFSAPTGFSNDQTLFVAEILNQTQFFAAAARGDNANTEFEASGSGTVATIAATSGVIPARSTAEQARAVLENTPSIGAGNLSVSAAPGKQYRLAYQNEKAAAVLAIPTVSGSLLPAQGKTANINFNTTELTNAISASATLEAVLEIELTQSGTVETVLQTPVTLRNDIIASGTPTPVSTISGTASFSILSPDSSVWSITIDNDGVLTASKL